MFFNHTPNLNLFLGVFLNNTKYGNTAKKSQDKNLKMVNFEFDVNG